MRTYDEMISERGRPRRHPDMVLGDRGYDHDKYRHIVWDLGVKPLFARRGTRTRWEIHDDIPEAFLALGCALICCRRLHSRCSPVQPAKLGEGTARFGSACCFLGGHDLIAVLEGPCADGVDGRQQGPAQSGELVLDPR